MNKKIIILVAVVVVILAIAGVCKIISNKNKANNETNTGRKVEIVESDNEFEAYSLNNITITNPNANLIFTENYYGDNQKELEVKVGDTFSFNKYGEKTIEVLELTNDYITISIDGLAPSKVGGGFSLLDDYDKVTIKKNTGVCLNIQATDLFDGSIYFYYVNKE